ncbi:MAG: type II toxin-antitoxin system YafQ family toxin [Bacteroidales bacterium]|nr:type II toxin-antitoxin system YafQ family toxin [Bacteroidales bacterium]
MGAEAYLPVPQEYLPHPLSGNWANHMECHIKGI